jgi:general nucleoside transport system permease protein
MRNNGNNIFSGVRLVFDKTQFLIIPLIAALCALFIGALIIFAQGADPVDSYLALFRGAFGGIMRIGNTIGRIVPLLFTGLAVAVAYKCGVFNLGGEGQLLFGGIGATMIAVSFPDMAPFLHITFSIIAAAVFGAAWAFIPGLLKAKLGIHALITTLMFNYIAAAIIEWVVRGPLQGIKGGIPASALIHDSAKMPLLFEKAGISGSVIIALVFIVLIFILMFKTTLGFKIRAVGLNQKATTYAGIKVSRTIITSMLMSGALAGMAGGIEVLSVTHRLWETLLHGYGFDGVAVALVGRLHPLGVLLSGIFFGALRSGANSMQVLMQVPVPLISIIQALTILFVVAGTAIRFRPELGKIQVLSNDSNERKNGEN